MIGLEARCLSVVAAIVLAACSGGSASEPPASTASTTGSTAPTEPVDAPPATEPAPPTSGESVADTPTTELDDRPVVPDDPLVVSFVETLMASGIPIVDDDTLGASPFAVPARQIEPLVEAARSGYGTIGSQIDELAAMPADFPSMSYVIAGWVSAADTPGARWASEVLGEHDWSAAPEITFPVAVVELFLADTLGAPELEPADSAPQGFRRAEGGLADLHTSTASAPQTCPAVAAEVEVQIRQILKRAALMVNSGAVPAPIGAYVLIAGEWILVDPGTLELLFESQWPLQKMKIAQAFATLATFAMFAGGLTGWTVTVTPSSATDRFAVGGEADRPQAFTASLDTSLAPWPQTVVDCAEAQGIDLPDPSGDGSTATWSTSGLPALGTETGRDDTFGPTGTAEFRWNTGREDTDDGEPIVGTVEATVVVDQEARQKLAQIWTAAYQAAVEQAGPLAAAVYPERELFASTVAAMQEVMVPPNASASVAVTHHRQGCRTGTWLSVAYRAEGQTTEVGAGTLTLVFTDEEHGRARFDPAVPILARVDSEDAPWVRMEFSGGHDFALSPDGLTWAMSNSDAVLQAYAELGGDWIPLDPIPLDDGNGGVSGVDLFTCTGDSLLLTVTAASWEFTRLT